MIKSRPFNIVICPPEKICEQAGTVSRELKKRSGLFVLNEQDRFAHITLYLVEFPLKNIPQIKKLLKQCAAETKPFPARSFKYGAEANYIAVYYQRSKYFKNLQDKIIKLVNPLRENLLREKDKEKLQELIPAEQKNVKLYGFRGVGSRFFPHLTFTKLGKANPSAVKNIKKLDFNFTANKLGLMQLGDHGTGRKIIATFNIA